MFKYKVTAPCYYGGVYRTPENKHSVVVVDKKFVEKEKPSYLELIEEPKEDKAK